MHVSFSLRRLRQKLKTFGQLEPQQGASQSAPGSSKTSGPNTSEDGVFAAAPKSQPPQPGPSANIMIAEDQPSEQPEAGTLCGNNRVPQKPDTDGKKGAQHKDPGQSTFPLDPSDNTEPETPQPSSSHEPGRQRTPENDFPEDSLGVVDLVPAPEQSRAAATFAVDPVKPSHPPEPSSDNEDASQNNSSPVSDFPNCDGAMDPWSAAYSRLRDNNPELVTRFEEVLEKLSANRRLIPPSSSEKQMPLDPATDTYSDHDVPRSIHEEQAPDLLHRDRFARILEDCLSQTVQDVSLNDNSWDSFVTLVRMASKRFPEAILPSLTLYIAGRVRTSMPV